MYQGKKPKSIKRSSSARFPLLPRRSTVRLLRFLCRSPTLFAALLIICGKSYGTASVIRILILVEKR